MRHLIVDVDAGSDDALALMVLLSEERRKQHKVVAITCTHGNTSLDFVCRNVLLVLDAMKRNEVPVFKGVSCSILNSPKSNVLWHGIDGFGDKHYEEPTGKIQDENAVAAINRLAHQYPGIAVMCLGPLTNLALALRTYPDLKDIIGEMWVMGGNNEKAIGNVPGTNAEFNFCQDPEAARIVFEEISCHSVMLPWELCIDLPIKKEWRFQVLGKIPSPHIQLLNKAEESLYENYISWIPCDALLAAIFLDDTAVLRQRPIRVSVRVDGQCAILPNEIPNVHIIDEIDCEKIQQIFLATACNYGEMERKAHVTSTS